LPSNVTSPSSTPTSVGYWLGCPATDWAYLTRNNSPIDWCRMQAGGSGINRCSTWARSYAVPSRRVVRIAPFAMFVGGAAKARTRRARRPQSAEVNPASPVAIDRVGGVSSMRFAAVQSLATRWHSPPDGPTTICERDAWRRRS